MLREIPFYLVMLFTWGWPFLVVMAFLSFLNKVTAKPKEPPHVDTPEEAAERQAQFKAEFARFAAMRAANAHHH